MRSARTQAASMAIYTNGRMTSGVHGGIVHTSVITTLWRKGLSRNSAVASLHATVRSAPFCWSAESSSSASRGWVSDMDAGRFDSAAEQNALMVPLMENA